MNLELLRKQYHAAIFAELLTIDNKGIPSNADKHSNISVKIAQSIVEQINLHVQANVVSGQTAGKTFEKLTANYLEQAFSELNHLRPGKYAFFIGKSIETFEQYEHLAILTEALKNNRALRVLIGDYIICPDIIVGRKPITDSEINETKSLLHTGDLSAQFTPLRIKNSSKLILHASISCKWTIRSDRSQNSRTEALNLLRNRKGNAPHIAIVTAEPYPQRIASLALGTGDLDCVYHFALPELLNAVNCLNNESVADSVETLVSGKRLRDISDLPFDMAI
ncbi:restriction endonuclease [Sphingobacteriales bacterium UPWRP_1]|nr:restriction endonuclease [Sphingobacteriales bacterium TSM_CSM]PSJ74341.1 restriction endonuclease [Sphingobacteriales bacterium UPWRP_1]